jgi:diguanylate cyclase (GGDEF)-like protein
MNKDAYSPNLEQILRNVPVGLQVRSEDGTSVYASEAVTDALALRPVSFEDVTIQGRTIRTLSMASMSGGASYDITFSLDVTEQVRSQQELFQRAYFDELTNLPNRRLVERSIKELIGSDTSPFALAFIDLDGFKSINDYYGHTIGDELLIKIAERLSSRLGPSDLLARVGGDEFVLLMSPITSVAEAVDTLKGLSERLKEPFYIKGFEILSSASTGVSFYPENGETYDILRTNADNAMYRGKSDAKGGVRAFDDTVAHAAAQKARTEQRLRLAIRDRRLCCAYQPKLDFRSDTVVGIEVLLRWRDENGVIRAPGDFIDLALELGLMDEIAFIVLSETTSAIDRINETFGKNVSISLNVAAKQAANPGFMQSLISKLSATGFASRFMLEITEEAFLASAEFQRNILPMIRAIGSSVSIDDFGVGYSSLAALADITADELKVDRSIITDIHLKPRSQSILRAIESLAQALDMKIVVEGVETFEELLYLQTATRISIGQGYYFSHPIVFDETISTSSIIEEPRAHTEARKFPPSRTLQMRA